MIKRKNSPTFMQRIRELSWRRITAYLLLLFYPFNFSISSKILLGTYNPVIFLIIAIALLIPDLQKRITKRDIKIVAIIIVIILLILVGNETLSSSPYVIKQLLIQLCYLVAVPFLAKITHGYKELTVALQLFLAEHLVGTALPIILPNFYEKHVLDFLCSGTSRCFARNGYYAGNNAGFTSHYSTNGAYIAVSALFFSGKYLKEKNKANLVLSILSLIGLLIIGKRAHLIFSIISIMAGYLTLKDKKQRRKAIIKCAKIIVVASLAILGVLAASSYFPQIQTTINRIKKTDQSDILGSREALYDLAINEWKEAPLLGNGWGHYIEASHAKFGKQTYGTDYIHTHNDYLELLCDRGIVGLSLYILILFSILIKTSKSISKTKYGLFAFQFVIFYILYSFTGTPLSIPVTYSLLLIFSVEERETL